MAIEAELYDAYARHALSPERSRRFENKFLATSEQRSRLEFSRALLRTAATRTNSHDETSGLGCRNIRGVDHCLCSDLEILAGSAKLSSHPTGSGLTLSCCRALRYWRRQYTKCFRRIGVAPFRIQPTMCRLLPNWNATPHPPFQAKLSTPEGTEIWKSDPARPIELLDDMHVKLDNSGIRCSPMVITS